MSYRNRCNSALSEADKCSATPLFRRGVNAARIARNVALSLLPGT